MREEDFPRSGLTSTWLPLRLAGLHRILLYHKSVNVCICAHASRPATSTPSAVLNRSKFLRSHEYPLSLDYLVTKLKPFLLFQINRRLQMQLKCENYLYFAELIIFLTMAIIKFKI